MEQFAIAQLAVFCYDKHLFRLVRAHTRLAESFLRCQCYQPAFQHLRMAGELLDPLTTQE
jgi:hypothetical protein